MAEPAVLVGQLALPLPEAQTCEVVKAFDALREDSISIECAQKRCHSCGLKPLASTLIDPFKTDGCWCVRMQTEHQSQFAGWQDIKGSHFPTHRKFCLRGTARKE
jgi:hypothetical protein